MLKTLLSGGCAIALALSLSGCVSSGAVMGASPTSSSGLTGDQLISAQKEFNRHLELCDRTYAWPFAVTIHCSPVAGPVAAGAALTAADVKAIVDKALMDHFTPAAQPVAH